MLNEDKIISIFCLVDDLLKGIGHKEDSRRKVSDSEVITTAIVSALYFGGHQDNGREFNRSNISIEFSNCFALMFDPSQHLTSFVKASLPLRCPCGN